ncbi:unnamed protein product [Sphagnum jensenii]|uniref:Uncharacterized protein n=1 Tax=Sphagnum jensenii TaxID=128206 RepID=A0ABP1ALP5_9BRYO
MPLANEDVEQAGYRTLLEKSVMPTFKGWQVQRTPSTTKASSQFCTTRTSWRSHDMLLLLQTFQERVSIWSLAMQTISIQSYWMVSGEVRQSDCCLMDSKDFNQIGVGVHDLIEAYMQGHFGMKLVQSLNSDPKLLAELFPTQLNTPLLPVELPDMLHVPNGTAAQVFPLIETEEDRLAKEMEQEVIRSQAQV